MSSTPILPPPPQTIHIGTSLQEMKASKSTGLQIPEGNVLLIHLTASSAVCSQSITPCTSLFFFQYLQCVEYKGGRERIKEWDERGEPALQRGLRDVIVCDQLLDVGQFLMEIFAAFLLFPVAWELLQERGKKEKVS